MCENTAKTRPLISEEFSSIPKKNSKPASILQDILDHTYKIEELSIKFMSMVVHDDIAMAELMVSAIAHLKAIQHRCCSRIWDNAHQDRQQGEECEGG
jgi:inosine-uridine nucleoside N-ribohydrolase